MPLTGAKCRNAKPSEKPQKLSDGGGLHLLVQPTGSKLWRQAYRFGGKQKLLSHGSYPVVSLADARDKRDAAKKLLVAGKDPGAQRQQDKRTALIIASNTFRAVAEEWFTGQKPGWTPAYYERLWRRLEADIFPGGNEPEADLTASHALQNVDVRFHFSTPRPF